MPDVSIVGSPTTLLPASSFKSIEERFSEESEDAMLSWNGHYPCKVITTNTKPACVYELYKNLENK